MVFGDKTMRPSMAAVQVFLLTCLVATNVYAQAFKTLAFFNGTDGAHPGSPFVVVGNTLYGTTTTDALGGDGSVFSVPVSGGNPTALGTFNGPNGEHPYASLTLVGNTLYGTTNGGPITNFVGTVFSIPLSGGNPTTLASLGFSNSHLPFGSLTPVGNALYGTTSGGGAMDDGTVFSIPLGGGTPTILASFNGSNGQSPEGRVTLSSDGKTLYGTTTYGGDNGSGTVYSVPVSGGTPTVLASFNGANGAGFKSALTLSGNTLYGRTQQGGGPGFGTIFSVPVAGGALTVLKSLDFSNDENPPSDLTLIGGKLYGTINGGGPAGNGYIFSLNSDGSNFVDLFEFNGANGSYSYRGLRVAEMSSTAPHMTVELGTKCSTLLAALAPSSL